MKPEDIAAAIAELLDNAYDDGAEGYFTASSNGRRTSVTFETDPDRHGDTFVYEFMVEVR